MDDPFATCKVPTTTFDRAMLDRILSKPRSKVMYISNDAGTVDATGYTGGTTYLVSKVEILSQ